MNTHLPLPKLVRDTISWYAFNIKLQFVHDELHKYFEHLEQKKRSRIPFHFNHLVRDLLWSVINP